MNANLPHGWQNWARFEEHDGRYQHDTIRFIEWAEPPPRDQSASRYAVVKHGVDERGRGGHIAWARVSPNPDVSTDYSSGGFYDDMPGGAVAAAKRAAMAHKEKIRGWTSRAPTATRIASADSSQSPDGHGQNRRWGPCSHCGASGWDVIGQRVSGLFDHDRPDGRYCVAAARKVRS